MTDLRAHTPVPPTGSGDVCNALAPLVEEAVALAHRWERATEQGQTDAERRTTGQLASLVRSPKGSSSPSRSSTASPARRTRGSPRASSAA